MDAKVATIALTDAGDAALDLSWYGRLEGVDRTVLVSRNLTPRFCATALMALRDGHALTVMGTCSGWGGTWLEPNAPKTEAQLKALRSLISSGIPKASCVLNVDPVVPTPRGLERTRVVFETARRLGLLPIVCRVAILREDPPTKRRFAKAKHPAFYGTSDHCTEKMLADTADFLREMTDAHGLLFDLCPSPELCATVPELCRRRPHCLCNKRLPAPLAEVPQANNPCLCHGRTLDVLDAKGHCSHGCLHCRARQSHPTDQVKRGWK